MGWRLYFLFGDLVAAIGAGALAGWVSWMTVSDGWFMPLAMAAGMVLGSLIGLVCAPLIGAFFGGFEILAPASLSGMMAGMVVASMEAMDPMPAAEAVEGGAMIGLLCLLATYALQWRLKGVVK